MRDEFDSKPLGQEEDDEEKGDGLIILKVIHDESGEELLSTCDSEEELEAAYAAFMEDLLEDEEEKDDEEPIFISVTAEDGEELTLEFVSVFEVDGQEYRAFFPAEEEEEECSASFRLHSSQTGGRLKLRGGRAAPRTSPSGERPARCVMVFF